MSDLISRKKIRDYVKQEINPYGKPFEGTAYELGLKIMKYIDSMDSAYNVDKVVEQLEEEKEIVKEYEKYHCSVKLDKAIEIVRKGGAE